MRIPMTTTAAAPPVPPPVPPLAVVETQRISAVPSTRPGRKAGRKMDEKDRPWRGTRGGFELCGESWGVGEKEEEKEKEER